MEQQLSFDFGVTAEESCMMCHLSSECSGCCKVCKSDGNCRVQRCGQAMRECDSNRLSTWLCLVNTYKELNDVAHRVLTKRQIKQYKIKKL